VFLLRLQHRLSRRCPAIRDASVFVSFGNTTAQNDADFSRSVVFMALARWTNSMPATSSRHTAAAGLAGTARLLAARRRIRHFTHHTYRPAGVLRFLSA
jgi:hypothetical protein